MKKICVLLFLCVSAMCIGNAQSASDYKAFIKERKAIAALSKDQMQAKVLKDIKKRAKGYEKEGWKVAPGALPIERQLSRSDEMQYEFDMSTGMPKYIRGEATSIGGNYDAAKMQASALAKTDLAGNIQTEVVAMVENKVENSQLGQEQAVSLTQSVMGGKQIIAQSIGRTITVVEMYRDLPNKNKEVRLVLLYNAEMAMEAAKKAIKEEMQKTADKLVDQVDALLGF